MSKTFAKLIERKAVTIFPAVSISFPQINLNTSPITARTAGAVATTTFFLGSTKTFHA